MKTVVEGHTFELDSFEGSEPQVLQFIHKEPTDVGYDTILQTVKDGTTNEEVLKCLITRMNYLQGKFSCRENAIVITKLEESLMWLEKRTSDRKARNVEGTNAK